MKNNFKIRGIKFIFSFLCILLLIVNGYSQSIQALEDKLTTASAEDKPGILNQLSEVSLASSPEKSIDYAERALKAARKADDVNDEAEANVNLANGYSQSGNLKKSINYLKDAIKIYERFNQKASTAVLWNKMAEVYVKFEKFEDAIDADNKAMELFKLGGDKKSTAGMHLEIGDIFFKQKKYEDAINHFKLALKVYEDLRDDKGEVVALNRIGATYSGWGNYDEAYINLNRAFDIAKKNNMNSDADAISKNMETVKKNVSNWQKSQTDFAQKKEKETQEQIKTKESQIHVLAEEKMKSIEEIEQLSVEAQNKELKIKSQQEEIIRKQLETEKQAKANELLKKEQELTDVQLKQQLLFIWAGAAFSILLIIFTVYVFIAYRNKKKANSILTQKNEIIYKQKEQIQHKNILITDSIDYAKSIQDAILPSVTSITKYFPESFVLYKPKDIVSGDFFWIHETNNCVFIAAADCTGHGVPGAFMSLLGFIMLDDIVKKIENASPAEILNEVNTQLMTTLHQDGQTSTGKFGMDIALIKYNTVTRELIFSGAHNPLVIVNNSEISELKADKVSIGTTKTTSFSDQKIFAKEGDMIYIYSDGYQDQIGGEKRKKYLAFHMKELFVKIHTMHMDQQNSELNKAHMEWRSHTDQTDDILIIGLKV